MKSKILVRLSIACMVPFFSCNLLSRGDHEHDPLICMDYDEAFDQSEIYKEFAPLMYAWGCAGNVFGDDAMSASNTQPKVALTENEKKQRNALEQQFTQACLKQLRSAQHWVLTEESRGTVSSLVLQACATLLLRTLVPFDSVAGGLGLSNLFSNMADTLKPVISDGYNLAYPPANPLGALEQKFARTQCFIPNALWPVIYEKFTIARTNEFERKKATDFLEFTLDLTTYKPKPAPTMSAQDLEKGIQAIFAKIDQFFIDYEKQSEENVWKIKNNVSKFITSLVRGDSIKAPRYVHLHGFGGIGKTFFVNQLSQWMEAFIPGSISSENIIISGADELEGNDKRPGAMLRVLRNQLRQNKRGALVFMDEASWLNKSEMISAAKRTFNGDQSKLSTSYFGNGVEGVGIELVVPPMLVFVASNEQITDPALKNRFDAIDFPMPKKEILVRYAKEIAEQSELVKGVPERYAIFDFEAWVAQENIHNFRDVAARIVPAILVAR